MKIAWLKDYVVSNKLHLVDKGDHVLLEIENNVLKELMIQAKQNGLLFQALIGTIVESKHILKYFFFAGMQNQLLLIQLKADQTESISDLYPAAYAYEREISARLNINFTSQVKPEAPMDHPDYFIGLSAAQDYHQLPVGPVHAGVIEPGHFHFEVAGEHIVQLSISLGYLHRGVDKSFIGLDINQGLDLSEHICGDSTVAYSLAFIQAVEKLSNIQIASEVLLLRSILLELERLYNHISDISGLVNDTGFALGQAKLLIQKEKLLRLNQRIFGHRFLRSSIGLAKTNKQLSMKELEDIKLSLKTIRTQFESIIAFCNGHSSVLERFSNTGILNHEAAQNLSVYGIAGKASGISFDSRKDLSFAAYNILNFHSHTLKGCDVLARYHIRYEETLESFHIINQALNKLSSDNLGVNQQVELTEKHWAWAMVEAARGPVFCYLEMNNGKINYCKMRDISLHNWKALETSILGNIVPDFPLCNKSFSLAYAGTDL